jgi:Cft2 family RNA processing exonuclease
VGFLYYIILLYFQLDFGIHPGYNGLDSLPFVDEIDAEEIDLLLISQ